MRPSIVSKVALYREQGMSMPEIIAVVMIMSVMASLGAASLLGLYNRNTVNQSFTELRSILRETQANAARKSLKCTVTVNTGTSPVTIRSVDSQGVSCAPNRTLADGVAVTMAADNNGTALNTIEFSYLGNTPTTTTAVVYLGSNPNLQKRCIAISEGIGLFVDGYYQASPTSGVNSGSCQTS